MAGGCQEFDNALGVADGAFVAVAADGDYGEMSVAGCLRVDDLLYDGFDRTLDGVYTQITGPLGYTFSNFKILPRDVDDATLAP